MSDIIYPKSVGASCINHDWFGMPVKHVWEIMEDYLYFIHRAYNVRIHVFVLMSNHFHMIISAPDHNLPQAMQYLLANSSREITKCAGRVNHTWKQHHFKTLIGTPHYYLHAYKYFYRNPVKAKICKNVEDYPFSTLHGLLGQSKLIIPVEHDETLFSDVEGTLRWLNTPPQDDHEDAVRKALRRRKFKLPRDKKSGMKHKLEEEPF